MDLFRLDGDENYDKICGQIIFTTKGRLAFYCTLCGKYWNYESFITHLLEKCSLLLDDDLKECICLKSLTGKSQTLFASIPKRNNDLKGKDATKEQKILHRVNLAPETQSETKVFTQPDESIVFKQEESMNCNDLPKSPSTNYMHFKEDVFSESECATESFEFDLNKECSITESIDEDLIVVDHGEGNINEYENFEYLEDEPIGVEIQNNFLINECEIEEPTEIVQSFSVNVIESKEDYKQDENKKQNKSKKTFVDEVTVPLVVRNVQVRNKYFPSHIAPEERKYKCPVCGAAFKDSTNRNYHLRRHTNNKKHTCSDCGKKFFTSTELRIHSRVHSKPENLFLCTECGRSFESNFKLMSHQKRHRNQRDYVCKVCNKGFFQFEGLKAHMSVHSSERPYSCKICGATFKRNHILKCHMKQHENKREYKCQLCEAAFNVQAGLHSHMKSKHKDYVQIV